MKKRNAARIMSLLVALLALPLVANAKIVEIPEKIAVILFNEELDPQGYVDEHIRTRLENYASSRCQLKSNRYIRLVKWDRIPSRQYFKHQNNLTGKIEKKSGVKAQEVREGFTLIESGYVLDTIVLCDVR